MTDDANEVFITGAKGRDIGSGSLRLRARHGDVEIEVIVSAAVLDSLHIDAGSEWSRAACRAIEEAAARKLVATPADAASVQIDVVDLRVG